MNPALFLAALAAAVWLLTRKPSPEAPTSIAPPVPSSATLTPDPGATTYDSSVAPAVIATSPTPTYIPGNGLDVAIDLGDGRVGVEIGVDKAARLSDAATLTWIQRTTPPPDKPYHMGHYQMKTMAEASPSGITDPADPRWGNGQSYNDYVIWINEKNGEVDRFNAESDAQYAKDLQQWQILQAMEPL